MPWLQLLLIQKLLALFHSSFQRLLALKTSTDKRRKLLKSELQTDQHQAQHHQRHAQLFRQ
jgi:hypothetical protein